ncbi:SDR family NAD(P)-dependent oxidoreductase [Rhodococcus opacus]|uniref:SDR family NAD(P)-dependent oxidoreductase n=1 Tax=Rhodococcus opacus TaxID=37919 RepID=UPI001C46A96F|nr:SDR family oxidoreductase [Rhodococcus opacus]MBV6760222.1 SDR family oxidoreductase [Rhodococcus opacus]
MSVDIAERTRRNIVVFGGASGIGHAVVAALVADGARVTVFDRAEPSAPLGEVDYRRVDVRDSDDVRSGIDVMLTEQGRVDGMVYAVGVLDGYTTLEETTEELLDVVLDVNVKGAVRVAQALVPSMKAAGGGRMVFFSSIAGSVAGAGGLAYTTSKHAMNGIIKSLALELGPSGITVNAVAPGSVPGTNIKAGVAGQVNGPVQTERGMATVFGQTAEQLHPVGRLGTVDAIAPTVMHLLEPSSWFITGTTVTVDGGYTAR